MKSAKFFKHHFRWMRRITTTLRGVKVQYKLVKHILFHCNLGHHTNRQLICFSIWKQTWIYLPYPPHTIMTNSTYRLPVTAHFSQSNNQCINNKINNNAFKYVSIKNLNLQRFW